MFRLSALATLAAATFLHASLAAPVGRAGVRHDPVAMPPLASYAETGSTAPTPYGWHDFCGRQPQECSVRTLAPVDIRLTRRVWNELVAVNRRVNAAIEPISNLEHWGTILDHWDYPVDGKGDCKIYALYKRKLLMEAGLPRQALLMTIVRDLNDEGHTILTVRTDRGEFVLDNLSEKVKPWNATGYRFIKRQSQEDPNVWVTLRRDETPAVATTVQDVLAKFYEASAATGRRRGRR